MNPEEHRPPEGDDRAATGENRARTEAGAGKPRGGGAAAVAWLALIAALAGGGWNFQQWQQLTDERESAKAARNEDARRVAALEKALARTEAELAARARAAEERQRALEEALSGIRSLAGLRDRSGWLLAEAEHLARLAAHTLRAKGDGETAAALLESADARLAEIGDPALHAARALLAADLTALRELPADPIPTHSRDLAALLGRVEELPLPVARAVAGEPAGVPQVPEERWEWRAWLEEAQRWLEESVVLRRDGERPEPLIAPEERYFLVQNLRLQLEAARLALYRDDERGYRRALGQARDWITRHFDPRALPTRTVLRELARLEQAPLTRPLPDLGESIAALRALSARPTASTGGTAP